MSVLLIKTREAMPPVVSQHIFDPCHVQITILLALYNKGSGRQDTMHRFWQIQGKPKTWNINHPIKDTKDIINQTDISPKQQKHTCIVTMHMLKILFFFFTNVNRVVLQQVFFAMFKI